MKIEINSQRKVFMVQKEFNKIFSNLKIKFYKSAFNSENSVLDKQVKSHNKILSDYRDIHNAGFITILPGISVGELTKNFKDSYGLTIKLFKRAGINKWFISSVSEEVILVKVNDEQEYLKFSSRH